jgi:hypothetical protein
VGDRCETISSRAPANNRNDLIMCYKIIIFL